MKKLVKMSRSVGALEGLYNHLNHDFFEDKLPIPIITIQSKKGTYGHCSIAKIWKREDSNTFELNIAAEVLNEPVEEIIDTMLHEMVHLYCRENNIQEVSRGGMYHNSKFKDLAEKCGLVCYKTEKYGYNTVGKGNEKLIEYALSIEFYGFEICRETVNVPSGFQLPTGSGSAVPLPTGSGSSSSTRKYQCPNCKNSFRATKNLDNMILCIPCGIPFVEVIKN